jgi:hypothetical protein
MAPPVSQTRYALPAASIETHGKLVVELEVTRLGCHAVGSAYSALGAVATHVPPPCADPMYGW